jgi:hypothetical protein
MRWAKLRSTKLEELLYFSGNEFLYNEIRLHMLDHIGTEHIELEK